MIQIKTKCPMCSKEHVVEVEESQYAAYIAGEHVQNAFPDLSPDQREMLISGICPECFDNLFPKDEDL